jgi:hypothetical protein
MGWPWSSCQPRSVCAWPLLQGTDASSADLEDFKEVEGDGVAVATLRSGVSPHRPGVSCRGKPRCYPHLSRCLQARAGTPCVRTRPTAHLNMISSLRPPTPGCGLRPADASWRDGTLLSLPQRSAHTRSAGRCVTLSGCKSPGVAWGHRVPNTLCSSCVRTW